MQNQNKTPDPTTDMSAMEDQLRQAAQRSDAGEDVDLSALASGAPAAKAEDKTAAGTKPGATQTATDTKAAGDDGLQTPKGQQAKQEAKPGEQPGAQKDAEREQKERERQDRTWEKLNSRRAELDEREARLREREVALERGGESRPAPDDGGYTAEQWEGAADKWEKEGKLDLADLAREKAKALRTAPPASRPGAAAREARPDRKPEETPGTREFEQRWMGHVAQLAEKHPDLKDPKSELYQATIRVKNSDPRFSQFNDGIVLACQIAQLELKAAKAESLEAKVKELNTELDKLRQATAPGGGGAESPTKEKPFEAMTPAEQEAHLLRLAAEAE